MSKQRIVTPLTELLKIDHPVILAGMNAVSGAGLAAAVSNAGGLGVVGGLGWTPKFMKEELRQLKEELNDPNLPFGVDLALPKVGGGARKTNHDYTHGQLPELIDVIIESGASLFVSAVGIPPVWAIDKLHENGILVMNMIGSPRHVQKCLDAGVDILCAQGTEGGGHTGDISTAVLIPMIVDSVKGKTSKMHGGPIYVVAAGGIVDSRGLNMALGFGASAVWVGTRFICAEEANASPAHQKAVITANAESTTRTLIYSGRPLRVKRNAYVDDFHENRADKIKELCDQGIVPGTWDAARMQKEGTFDLVAFRAHLMGQGAGAVSEMLPASEIIREMVEGTIAINQRNTSMIKAVSSL
jgi:NAD(P)H-dependent flavin oxidoreductase YrpB (nitropropane dioxygenase family)